MGVYTLDGIPSDVLTDAPIGQRKLRVDGTFSAGAPVPTDSLYNKVFTYTANGDLDTITTTDTNTGDSTLKTFSYDANFVMTGIVTTQL